MTAKFPRAFLKKIIICWTAVPSWSASPSAVVSQLCAVFTQLSAIVSYLCAIASQVCAVVHQLSAVESQLFAVLSGSVPGYCVVRWAGLSCSAASGTPWGRSGAGRSAPHCTSCWISCQLWSVGEAFLAYLTYMCHRNSRKKNNQARLLFFKFPDAFLVIEKKNNRIFVARM